MAEEAALASRELPAGWQTRADPQGRPYYLHEASGNSLREHPRDAEFKQILENLDSVGIVDVAYATNVFTVTFVSQAGNLPMMQVR